MEHAIATIDGNEAAARIAHLTNEVIAIYPITPASPMGELADAWSVAGRKNIFGTVPEVVEMQSEGGAAGAVHGSLQAGALTTTFTASQGLLLMIPNLYKIAGELTAAVVHVAARTVATHALSIFGDHSDVMAARATGFAMLCSGSVQEAQDFALLAQATTLKARVPFLHFFDGFRTSHELNAIELLSEKDVRSLIDFQLANEHRARGLDPDRPVLRGTAQNPDVFFQAREAVNPFYAAVPGLLKETMDAFAERTGRRYRLFDYTGAPDADRVIVMMGSGSGAAEEAVAALCERGEKVGLLRVRLFRPFDADAFLAPLPSTVRSIAVLDRTKEPGALGEPLYLDVVAALAESGREKTPRVIGGRYGLSSKEFTPAMALAVFRELGTDSPKRHFTIGIADDVTRTSLSFDEEDWREPAAVTRAVFYGLGSDGTVGANKSSVKIIGEHTRFNAQGYFVYDSRKAGSQTVSHLRFSEAPIRSSYQIRRAGFVACHQFQFLFSRDVLSAAEPGGIFLLNSPHPPDRVWDELPREVQGGIVANKLRFFVVDAYDIARRAGLGGRINIVMQTCFFALTELLPQDEALRRIKESIQKSYGKRGQAVVDRNFAAADAAVSGLSEVSYPGEATSALHRTPPVPQDAPDFVQKVTAILLAGKGDLLPVSALPPDGTFPTGTARYEKRSIAQEIPVWDAGICIECGLCAFVCPHAVIRSKAYVPEALEAAPAGFPSRECKGKDLSGLRFSIQVSPDDCTGCGVCVDICPAHSKEAVKHKAINMERKLGRLDEEREWWRFFEGIPELDRSSVDHGTVKGSQYLQPLFEFSGACAGCGETPYLKLVTQLFGDRIVVANATGCSSIYGGNLPTTPWSTNAEGRGPAWSNSLFEDNAEFGFGMRLGADSHRRRANALLRELEGAIDADLAEELLAAACGAETDVSLRREGVARLKEALASVDSPAARELSVLAEKLVPKSVWIVGGDGWAYDIGFGGLDHVLASNRDVNVLVLDTEVYSNTGGQASKATPRGAVAKFATGGRPTRRKDLGMLAVSYGHVYVAQVALGAHPLQTIKAFREAESYRGPSLIIAYSQCIAHGIDMSLGMSHQKDAVGCGFWPLYRYDPRLARSGEHPFRLDSRPPKRKFLDYAMKEARFATLHRTDPEAARRLFDLAQQDIDDTWHYYEQMAGIERSIAVGMAGEME